MILSCNGLVAAKYKAEKNIKLFNITIYKWQTTNVDAVICCAFYLLCFYSCLDVKITITHLFSIHIFKLCHVHQGMFTVRLNHKKKGNRTTSDQKKQVIFFGKTNCFLI